MSESFSPDELGELIELAREGVETAQQHSHLEQILRHDMAARRYYVRYLLLCSELRTLGQGDRDHQSPSVRLPARATDQNASSPKTRNARRGRWFWLAGAAVALVLATFVWSWRRNSGGGPEATPNSIEQRVATLGATMDAEWEDGKVVAPGTGLSSGAMQLRRGLVELQYANGATVILEGPAHCMLDSTSRLSLQSGRISALVPAEAIGFTVQTPEALLVDLGTEFGVSSERAGATDVHVFRGQVALGDRLDKSKGKQLVSQGTAKRVEAAGHGEPEDIPANELAFVRQQEFEARIKARQNSPYHRWLSYSYGLRRDPALVLYFTFDNQMDIPERLLNRAGATAGKLDGVLGKSGQGGVIPQWVAGGRWPEQRALRFDADSRCWVRVAHSNELNMTQALSLATWLRPGTALLGETAVIVSKPARVAEMGPNYELGLRRRTDSRGNILCSVYLQCGSRRVETEGQLLAPGKWTHVAATTNHDHTVIYVDGKPAVRGEGCEPAPNNSDLWIGNTVPGGSQPDATPNQPFEGFISELALIRRAMSDEEILGMYMAGRQER